MHTRTPRILNDVIHIFYQRQGIFSNRGEWSVGLGRRVGSLALALCLATEETEGEKTRTFTDYWLRLELGELAIKAVAYPHGGV